MIFIHSLSLFFILCFVIVNVKQYLNINKSFRYLSCRVQENIDGNVKRRIVVLIPVMNECDIIISTISYFSNIVKNNSYVKVVFITTEKEGGVKENKTYKKITRHLSDAISLEHYPFKTGNKAEQVNYVVEKYAQDLRGEGCLTYYGIFDADSRPDPRGFEYIAYDEEPSCVYQMLPMYSTNFDELTAFGKAAAIFQTRWMMSHELPTLLENYRKNSAVNFSYCIGHGLFIQKMYLQNNPFSTETVTEDLFFGYQAVMKGVYAKPIPYFDYCASAYRFFDSVLQSARWHTGDLLSLFILIKKECFLKKEMYVFMIIKRFIHMLQWPFGPVLTSFFLFISIFFQNWTVFYLIMLMIFFYVFLLHVHIVNTFFRQESLPLFIYFFIFIKSAVNGVGALCSYYFIFSKRKLFWFKTPRE
ncbi:hypothetical protein WCU61_16350 [Pectobacterium versatile]|uniref:hypothetical protein n=1 Tax=Pectobacterium versatile TaxID=2488639 RepID=UPI00301A8318